MECFDNCEHVEFAGPWHTASLSFKSTVKDTAHDEFQKDIRRQLLHFTASLMSPFFCLAVEEGVQWPQVLLVMPLAKIWTKTIQAYALTCVDPLPNDYDHTKVEMPAQQCFCPKTFEACNSRHICAANAKVHLQSIPIRNILAVGIYKTKKHKVQSVFTKTPSGHFELNQTKEATDIRNKFHQYRKQFFDDYELVDTSNLNAL